MKKSIRDAVWVTSDGRSDASGAPLREGEWHVDHIVPRAVGGTDDLGNLRATTAGENMAKSDACPDPLRQWQGEFVTGYHKAAPANYLLVALPGAGKTYGGLTVARDWIADDPDRRRVLIIVPTDPLRTQWRDVAARSFGVQCTTKETYTFKTTFQGIVTTYQAVAASPAIFRKLCVDRDVLVICDEIHHASDGNEWGANLKTAIEVASRRLLMSGTPFRSDKSRIPFINYDGLGQCIADYTYDYPRAVRDGVVRVVRFQHDKGIVRRLSVTATNDDLELHSGVSDDDADEALRALIEPGNYTARLLSDADQQLEVCRRARGDMGFAAGGVVICRDQDHATRIAAQLSAITHEAPALIISDDGRATSTVPAFRASDQRWVVAVKQLSEGVDIPRLMVLVYLTTCKTSLFFRQAVGRIVRNQGTDADMEAYAFIPDHPVLVRHASTIVEAQANAIEEDDSDDEPRSRDARQPELWPSGPTVLGTEHTGTAGYIIDGEQLTASDAQYVHDIATEYGVPESKAWQMYKRFREREHSAPPMPPEGRASCMPPLEDQVNRERKDLQKLIAKVAHRRQPYDIQAECRRLWKHVHRHVGKWSVKEYTLDELRRAKAFVGTVAPEGAS